MIQKRRRFLWAKAHFNGLWQSGKLFCVRRIKIWSSFLGKLGRHVIRTKGTRTTQVVISTQFRACISDGMGLHECVWHGQAYTSGKAPSMYWKVYPSSLEQHYCSHPDVVSFREDLAFSNMTMPDNILHQLQHHGCVERRIRVLKWPACSPDLSPIENIWRIIKRKMRQRRPKSVEQLEACIRQEWDNIPIPNLSNLSPQSPDVCRLL